MYDCKCVIFIHWASLIAQLVKNPPAKCETWFPFSRLGRSPGEGKDYPVESESCSILPNFATAWTIQSMEFSRPEYCTSPGYLPNSGTEPKKNQVNNQVYSLPAEPEEKPKNTGVGSLPFSSGSSQPRNQTGVSCIASGFFTN